MTTTKKLSKAEIREDKVATAIKDIGESVHHYLKWVIAVVAAVVITIVAVVVITQTRTRAEANASSSMAQAQTLYFAGDYAQAQTQFTAIAGHYGSTKAGRLAPLFLGNCQLALGTPAEAEQSFRTFLSRAGKEPAMKSAALRGLGASLADQSKPAEAAVEFAKAASVVGNDQAADDWMSAGLFYSQANQNQEAIQAFRTVVDDYSDNRRVQEARVSLEEALAR